MQDHSILPDAATLLKSALKEFGTAQESRDNEKRYWKLSKDERVELTKQEHQDFGFYQEGIARYEGGLSGDYSSLYELEDE